MMIHPPPTSPTSKLPAGIPPVVPGGRPPFLLNFLLLLGGVNLVFLSSPTTTFGASPIAAAQAKSCGPGVYGSRHGGHCFCHHGVSFPIPLTPSQREACNAAVGDHLVSALELLHSQFSSSSFSRTSPAECHAAPQSPRFGSPNSPRRSTVTGVNCDAPADPHLLQSLKKLPAPYRAILTQKAQKSLDQILKLFTDQKTQADQATRIGHFPDGREGPSALQGEQIDAHFAQIQQLLLPLRQELKDPQKAYAFLAGSNIQFYESAAEGLTLMHGRKVLGMGSEYARSNSVELVKNETQFYAARLDHFNKRSCDFGGVIEQEAQIADYVTHEKIRKLYLEGGAAAGQITACYALNVGMLAPLVYGGKFVAIVGQLSGGIQLAESLKSAVQEYEKNHHLSRQTEIGLATSFLALATGIKASGLMKATLTGARLGTSGFAAYESVQDLIAMNQKHQFPWQVAAESDNPGLYAASVCSFLNDVTGVAYGAVGIKNVRGLALAFQATRAAGQAAGAAQPPVPVAPQAPSAEAKTPPVSPPSESAPALPESPKPALADGPRQQMVAHLDQGAQQSLRKLLEARDSKQRVEFTDTSGRKGGGYVVGAIIRRENGKTIIHVAFSSSPGIKLPDYGADLGSDKKVHFVSESAGRSSSSSESKPSLPSWPAKSAVKRARSTGQVIEVRAGKASEFGKVISTRTTRDGALYFTVDLGKGKTHEYEMARPGVPYTLTGTLGRSHLADGINLNGPSKVLEKALKTGQSVEIADGKGTETGKVTSMHLDDGELHFTVDFGSGEFHTYLMARPGAHYLGGGTLGRGAIADKVRLVTPEK